MRHRWAIQLLTQARLPFPAVVYDSRRDEFAVYSETEEIGRGASIADAMEDAREHWERQVRLPPYKAEGLTVTRSGEVEATAKSRSMANRIANALNLYIPNKHGL